MQVHVNPFFALRTNANLTLGDLSAYSRIDTRALSRSEKGLYTNPLPRLVEYWVNTGKVSEGQLVSDYEDFQFNTRQANGKFLGETLSFNKDIPIHPLRQLRNNAGLPGSVNGNGKHSLGLTEFCESLCVPLDTIQWWEKKWRNQKTVPKGLLAALNQAGYSQTTLREFCNAFAEWRNTHNTVVFS